MHSVWQPILEDDLVLIQPLSIEDLDQLYAAASDPLIWEQHPAKERATREGFRKFFDEAMASGCALAIIDRNSQEIIGTSRYHVPDGFSDLIEIGWTFLARKYWGGKYNRCVKRLMINHALQFATDIIFVVDLQNLRSQLAVEKLGAVPIIEGDLATMRDPCSIKLTGLIANSGQCRKVNYRQTQAHQFRI
jgi:RimJ/RimL family protein N-acetyltransferase